MIDEIRENFFFIICLEMIEWYLIFFDNWKCVFIFIIFNNKN